MHPRFGNFNSTIYVVARVKYFVDNLGISLSRFVNGMVYYGIIFSIPYVGGNMYLNFFLASLVEFPAIPGGIWIYDRSVT